MTEPITILSPRDNDIERISDAAKTLHDYLSWIYDEVAQLGPQAVAATYQDIIKLDVELQSAMDRATAQAKAGWPSANGYGGVLWELRKILTEAHRVARQVRIVVNLGEQEASFPDPNDGGTVSLLTVANLPDLLLPLGTRRNIPLTYDDGHNSILGGGGGAPSNPENELRNMAERVQRRSVVDAVAPSQGRGPADETARGGGGGPLAVRFSLDFMGRGPQSVARAAVAARDHATPDGPGVELAALFGVPGGGGDAGPGSGGPSVDLASLFGVPAGPGKVSPTPGGPGVDLSALFGVDLGRGPSVSTVKGPGKAPGGPPGGGGGRPNPTRTRSTDSGKQTTPRDNSGKSTGDLHTTERADPHPSASTSPGPAPNPAPAKSEPTTADPAAPGKDPSQTGSTGSAPATPKKDGTPTVKDGAITVIYADNKVVTYGKEPPPPPPPPPKKDDRPDPNDDSGGGGGPRRDNNNPDPESTGGSNPRARDASSRYRPADDDGGGGRGGGGGPRSYDAYPDPESSGGGNPRGRFEMPNPEDAVGPRGPSARLSGRNFGNWFGSGSGAL